MVERSELWRRVLNVRLIASLAIPAALALLPVFGPNRLPLALVAAVVGLLCNLGLFVQVNRHRTIPSVIAVADLLTALIVVAVIPETYNLGIVVIVSMTALYVFWFGTDTTVRLIVMTGAALLAIGLWRQPDMWVAGWTAWALTAVFGTVILSRVASSSTRSRNRYNDLINGIDALVWEGGGPSGDADYVSDRVFDLLGFTPTEYASFTFLASHVHADDVSTVVESRRRIAEGQDVEVQFRIRDARGRTRHMQERVTVATDAEGRTRHRRGVVVDVTARFEAESSVRGYADFIEGIPVALAILRLDDMDDATSLRVVVGNPAAARLVGLEPDTVIGRRVTDMLPDRRDFMERLADVARLGTSLERPFVPFDELDEVYALRAMPLPDQCIGVSLDDVTKRARVAESLRHQAMHDHLTGLPNRARFHERLGRAIEQSAAEHSAAENGSVEHSAVEHSAVIAGSTPGGNDAFETGLIMIDLNQFKEVNDTLGHEFGDKLLTELARRLSRNLRGCDTIARLGGDEFAILVTGPGAGHAAEGVAQRVLELTSEAFVIDEFRLQIGASIGIAVHPEHASDAQTLMRHADGAMYKAKQSGGGIVNYAAGHDLANASKLELLAELRTAVQSDEMVVHYQPRIDLTSLEILGVEALVRWHHPERGLLPPGEFIELAEVSGAIQPLTRLVTERATADLAHLEGASELRVNINLSGRNLHDPMLINWVTELLERSDFPPSSLCFELTETQLTADPPQALETLHRLRRLGVHLSVDDFGTGYSSLAYLRELPIDEVKIDRSFIADLEDGDPTLVRSVIELGHNLGLHVVAEGVETPEALAALRELGCDSAQGFHFAMPMALPELIVFLDQEDRSGVERAGARP